MKQVLGLFFFCLSFSAFGANSKNCTEIKSEQIRLALTASNLRNENTTRTPEGGAYRPFKIKSCSNGGCNVGRTASPILKYLPDHPDADQNGYVAFPNMDISTEYATFNMTAAKLRLLGSEKLCGTQIIDNGSSVLLSYSKKNSDIKEDIFNFDKNQQVVSWMRTDLKGATTTVNFFSNGKIASHQ